MTITAAIGSTLGSARYATPTFFSGLSDAELAQILVPLERKPFAAGMTVLLEGEQRHAMYVVEAGTADVFISDRDGGERRVGRIGPGATIGEMALFTGQPASATVRATTDLHVWELSENDFLRAAAAFPRIYHNLGAILSERLARTNRHALHTAPGEIVVLHDHGAPPMLGYALACSVAWHTRKSVLLLILKATTPAEFESLAHTADTVPKPIAGRAHVVVGSPEPFAPPVLENTLDDLCHSYDYVFVQINPAHSVPLSVLPVRLVGAQTPLPPGDDRQGSTLRGWVSSRSPRPDRSGVLHVPPLNPADERALASGVLPATTAVGKTVGWAARKLAGLSVGLALGAGSVKGYAHLGVLRVLERAGLPIDYLAGTSIGAVVGAMYALGYGPDDAARLLESMGSRAFRLAVPLRSLLSNAGVRANFRQVGGDTRFEDLELPFAVVATDIMTGQEVILRRGLLRPAVLASMSIPGVYPPVHIGEHMLVDGGVINPVPSNVAAAMGANTVIAVKLASWPVPPAAEIEALESTGPLPTVVQVINRSIEVMQSKITTDTAAAATLLIEPSFAASGSLGLRSFTQGRRFIPLGEEAAEAALPRIAAALPWLRN